MKSNPTSPETPISRRSRDGRPRWAPAGLLRRLWLPMALGALVIVGPADAVQAQYDDGMEINREYAIKAAYLYQFARYVQWPPNAFANDNSPLVIGVLGRDPFGGILEEIAQTKRVDGRPMVIRRFATMADYTPCHILFISASVGLEERAEAIQKTRGTSVLLVGEEPGFAEQGGTVNFFMDQNKIRFEINAETAKQDQLKISSKLLSLAKIVGRY